MKKKIKSKVIVDVITTNRCGFAIPVKEQLTLFSENIKKKDLDYEWATEGPEFIKAMIPNRRIEKIEAVSYFDLKGNEIK